MSNKFKSGDNVTYCLSGYSYLHGAKFRIIDIYTVGGGSWTGKPVYEARFISGNTMAQLEWGRDPVRKMGEDCFELAKERKFYTYREIRGEKLDY